jgi:hypothetical protein
VESIQQTINGSVGFGNKVSTQISRNGDLITDIVVEFVLTKAGPTFYCAEQLLQDVELEIGGQRIDKHYADWFRMYDSLFRMDNDRQNYRRMTDFVNDEPATAVKRFYVPLINNNVSKSITPITSGHCGWENRLDFQVPSVAYVSC